MSHVLKIKLSVCCLVKIHLHSGVSTYFAPFNAGYNIQHDSIAQHNKRYKNVYSLCKIASIEPNVYEITQDL